jgi:hypothetical protein
MSKIGFGATVGAATLILTVAAGASLYQLKSATASLEVQTSRMIDLNEIMKRMDVRTLRQESWPAI